MKLLVQRPGTPCDWEQHDSSDWNQLPMSRVQALCVQGVVFEGYSFYSVEHRGDDCVVWAWNDRQCYRWYFEPLMPDPKLGGAVNTRQARTVWTLPDSNLLLPSAQARPGGVVHEGFQRERGEYGWRHWGKDGFVPDQRPLGLYSKSKHTLTFYQRSTAQTNNAVVFRLERALSTVHGGGATNVGLGGYPQTGEGPVTDEPNALFTLNSPGQINTLSWPTGQYRVQWDVTQIGVVDTFRSRFLRVSFDTSTLVDSHDQDEAAFSGTGLKLASYTGSWTDGGATDRYCVGTLLTDAGGPYGAGGTLANTMLLRMSADAYADGPWIGPDAGMYWHARDDNLNVPCQPRRTEVVAY